MCCCVDGVRLAATTGCAGDGDILVGSALPWRARTVDGRGGLPLMALGGSATAAGAVAAAGFTTVFTGGLALVAPGAVGFPVDATTGPFTVCFWL